MLSYNKLPLRDAKHAWSQNHHPAVPVATCVRDLIKSGATGFPAVTLPPKRRVYCLYHPETNNVLCEFGIHLEASFGEVPNGKPSTFLGFVQI